MGPRAGLDRRKISSPPGFDPGPSRWYSVAIPTELPGNCVINLLYLDLESRYKVKHGLLSEQFLS